MPTLDREGEVFILDIGETENRFHPDWIGSVTGLLDQVENADGPRALVTTARGKFFSNGLDLDWLSAHREQAVDYLIDVHGLLTRILTFPMVTVAAVQGHAFAAGAMLSLAHDFRVMRADRGFWCLPESQINIAFNPGMTALVRARLHPQVAHEAMVTARRYPAEEALAAAIVDRTAAADRVRLTAVDLARTQATQTWPIVGPTKRHMYAAVIAAMESREDLFG